MGKDIPETVVGGNGSAPGESSGSPGVGPDGAGGIVYPKVGKGLTGFFSGAILRPGHPVEGYYRDLMQSVLEMLEFDQAMCDAGLPSLSPQTRIGIGFAAMIGVAVYFKVDSERARGKKSKDGAHEKTHQKSGKERPDAGLARNG